MEKNELDQKSGLIQHKPLFIIVGLVAFVSIVSTPNVHLETYPLRMIGV